MEQNGDIQRHHGNGGAGLSDQGLIHRNESLAADGRQLLGNAEGGFLQILFGLSDGTVFINSVGYLRPDIGISHCGKALCEKSLFFQEVDPKLPVLSAHHLDGCGDLLAAGRLDGNLFNLIGAQVDAPAFKRSAYRF